MHDNKLSIAVLISGGGTTLRNLIQRVNAGRLDVDIRLVVSSSSRATGLRFARDAGIETQVIRLRDFEAEGAFSEAIFSACRGAQVEFVVMGGFLKHILIPPDFQNRVINIDRKSVV